MERKLGNDHYQGEGEGGKRAQGSFVRVLRRYCTFSSFFLKFRFFSYFESITLEILGQLWAGKGKDVRGPLPERGETSAVLRAECHADISAHFRRNNC